MNTEKHTPKPDKLKELAGCGGLRAPTCSPIDAAWREYHGPVDNGNGEPYIPAMPPAFRRGFVDGYEHALKRLKPLGDELARIINIGAEEPVEKWATDEEMDRAVEAWNDLFPETVEAHPSPDGGRCSTVVTGF